MTCYQLYEMPIYNVYGHPVRAYAYGTIRAMGKICIKDRTSICYNKILLCILANTVIMVEVSLMLAHSGYCSLTYLEIHRHKHVGMHSTRTMASHDIVFRYGIHQPYLPRNSIFCAP